MNEKIDALNRRIQSRNYEIESLKRGLLQISDEMMIECYAQSISELEAEVEEIKYEITCIKASTDFSVDGLFQSLEPQEEALSMC